MPNKKSASLASRREPRDLGELRNWSLPTLSYTSHFVVKDVTKNLPLTRPSKLRSDIIPLK